jgi:ParB family chromosome partitioning protein
MESTTSNLEMENFSSTPMEEPLYKTTRRDILWIDPRNVYVVDGFNSRIDFDLDELVESIRANGIKNPIAVISEKDDEGNDKYRLVDGERRYRATMRLLEEGFNIARIPALPLSKSLKQDELLVEQLIRNEGKHFSEYEYGIAFRKFIDLGYKPQEIVKRLGLAKWKTIFLTHTERDPRVQDLLRDGKIEGAEVRRIYQAHGKNDEKGAVNEILRAAKKLEENGKKKITVKDLDINSKTIVVRDSSAIKKGLELLFKYYAKATNNGEKEIELDIMDIYAQLKEKKTIDDILTLPEQNKSDDSELNELKNVD